MNLTKFELIICFNFWFKFLIEMIYVEIGNECVADGVERSVAIAKTGCELF